MIGVLIALTAAAAYFDVRTRKIPNWLCLAGIAVGVLANTILTGLPGLKTAILGLFAGFLLYLPLWLLGARGAGDVKLLAAAGSLMGHYNTLLLALIAAIAGGILALGLVIYKGAYLETSLNIRAILGSLIHFRRPTHTLSSPSAIRLPHALILFFAAVILGGILNG